MSSCRILSLYLCFVCINLFRFIEPVQSQSQSVEAMPTPSSLFLTIGSIRTTKEVRGTNSKPASSNSIYLGCFKDIDIEMVSTSYSSPTCGNPKTCSEMCLARNKTFTISAMKGLSCKCVAATATLSNTNIQRLPNKYCDLNCDAVKDCYKFENHMTCGGNFAFSVSCIPSSINESCKINMTIYETNPEPYEESVQPIEIGRPYVECATPIPILSNSDLESFYTFFNYAPKNSPNSCVRFCMAIKTKECEHCNRTQFAVLVSQLFYTKQESYCYCYAKEAEKHWKEVGAGNCSQICPGDTTTICGGKNKKYFTIYDLENLNRTTTTESGTPEAEASNSADFNCTGRIASGNCRDRWLVEEENRVENTDKLNTTTANEVLSTITFHSTETDSYTATDIPRILTLVTTTIDRAQKNNIQDFENLTSHAVLAFGGITTQKEKWSDMKENRSRIGSYFLKKMEDTSFKFAVALGNQSGGRKSAGNKDFKGEINLQISAGFIRKADRSSENNFTYPSVVTRKTSFIELPKNWTQHVNSTKIKYVGITLQADTVEQIYGSQVEHSSKEIRGKRVNSDLISLSLQDTNFNVAFAGAGAKITFRHVTFQQESEEKDRKFVRKNSGRCENPEFIKGTALCAYWNVARGVWSPDGCNLKSSNETYSICECNHLTAFALLVDVNDYVGSEPGLEILTLLLCPIAVFCLILSILLMTKFSVSFGVKNIITVNLCSCLLVVNLLVLFLTDRNYFCLNKTFCAIVGAITHYVMLCALCWMAMEGILLYKMVIKVFDSGNDHLLSQHILGYGLPILVLAINGLTGFLTGERPYGGHEFCYLNGSFTFSFIIPLAIVVLGNTSVLIRTLRIAYNRGKSNISKTSSPVSLMRCIRGSIFISVLLGVTWMTGFVMLVKNYTISTIGAYAFTILNASQGILIFGFHLKSNEKLWGGLRNKILTWSRKPFQKSDTSMVQYMSYDTIHGSGSGETKESLVEVNSTVNSSNY